MGLIRFIAVFFVIYLLVKGIGRLFTPKNSKKEDFIQDTTTENKAKQKKMFDKEEGDYVDFEEVENS